MSQQQPGESPWSRAPFEHWWSWIRLVTAIPHFNRTGQVGDGREAAVRDHVLAHATAGAPESVLAAVDAFARGRRTLVAVGDEKGLILDAVVRRVQPKLALELGTYCGYSAIRTARLLPPGSRLVSVEFSAANAEIARTLIAHAGLADRVTVVVGTLGDGGTTIRTLTNEHGFAPGEVDFVFIDHIKDAYLSDLRLMLSADWLHQGSIVLADNIKFPGVPDYRKYMRTTEGSAWRTTWHRTHVEYQSMVSDLMLESEFLG